MVCLICGKECLRKRKWQEYCSQRCRMLAWAKRELAKENAPPAKKGLDSAGPARP